MKCCLDPTMDREANLPVPSGVSKNLSRPINTDSTSTSSSFFSSSSPPDFLRHVQAAFKRHRPLGKMQLNSIKPRRLVVPQREVSKSSASQPGIAEDMQKSRNVASLSRGHPVKDLTAQTKSSVSIVGDTQEDASITPPSILGATAKTFDESFNQCDAQRDEPKLDPMSSLDAGQQVDSFSVGSNKISKGLDCVVGNQGEASIIINNDESGHQIFHNAESDINLKYNSGLSLSTQSTTALEGQLHHFRNFLNQPVTQSSVVGPVCATTTSVHSASAPMRNSTTHCSHLHPHGGSHVPVEPMGDSSSSQRDISGLVVKETTIADPDKSNGINTQIEIKEYNLSKERKISFQKETKFSKNASLLHDMSTEGKGFIGDVMDVASQSHPKSLTSEVKLEPPRSDKREKVASGKGASVPRKRNYDPDMFFKVNGKLYQRLGKIGSGGSSEVHKVISSDCTIYALKKIKLKGRDYATAYGFCQEIVYLNKLRGKKNIIQLVDYEVTDKTLLQEVMNGSISNKDARVKDDGYIYMVLEYGEIDLAHMLSQKWKEMDGSNKVIDENWLRFYWQQILHAVNTIHEERIVHSDLKPANFLLVKGSLKLIDFGIAKAIMSDTTNIRRNSQVGTLSYMSPEAFMCNENDANGNTIKCGRPSDIWSLGCILYQMVYRRTPFSEYKTFWAKFKVITDPNHEIKYEPVSNPYLLDLMKKCLAWDRNERWRIPQLLQHPFLVPPVSPHLSLSQYQSSRLLQLIAETCANEQEASLLCSQLQESLREPARPMTSLLITSSDHQCELLPIMSEIYLQLRKRLSDLER